MKDIDELVDALAPVIRKYVQVELHPYRERIAHLEGALGLEPKEDYSKALAQFKKALLGDDAEPAD